jgi:twitching motility protein PilT
VDYVNENRRGHILTIEDPIEFVHPSKKCLVNQREVGPHTGSFSAALRAALREDPDVILVGELRDLETTALAITAAETGHLVFATLHTSSASKTVDRIIDVFPAEQQAQVRTMLSESIEGVIAQTLLPSKDGKGRVAAMEVLIGVPALRNLIRENKTAQILSVIQTGAQHGMQSLDQSLQDLVMRGALAREEAVRRSANPRLFETAPGGPAGGGLTAGAGGPSGAGRPAMAGTADAARRPAFNR